MRCPKCGSDNAPDSRFCGVCGLPQSKLAPTTKISDDAPFAPPTRSVQPISPVAGVSYSPPSMPPQNVAGLAPQQQAGLTTRPGGHAAPPRTGDHGQVRPSGDYQQVRPSGQAPGRQSFDSITPTGRQERTPMPDASQRPSGQRSLAHAPMASSPSMSFSAAPSRPLGLIAIVLVIDLALAGTGAALLAKGMSSPAASKAEAKPAPDKKSELPAPSATAVAAASPTAPSPATAVVTATPVEPAAAPAAAAPESARVETAAAARSKRSPTAASTGPVTSPSAVSSGAPVPVTSIPTTPVPTAPVQPLSTAAQIDTLANQSAMAFQRCRGDQTPAGAITIAFNVQPDGSVANAASVENTTGNDELGACLARVIGGWRVSAFQGNTMSFVRPFHYP